MPSLPALLSSEIVEEEEDELLFYMILVIELQEVGDGSKEPFTAYRLPNLWEKDPFSKNVASFCFPDTTPFPLERMEDERFSFVLTEDDGDRRFGYCLRKLAQGTGMRMPICFVVLTYLPCDPLYNKILDKVAYHYENSSGKLLTQFLESVIQNSFPKPGENFSVRINDTNQTNSWTLTRPETDLSLSQLPIDEILVTVSSVNLLRIFSSILLERRIIFCAKKIATLSDMAKIVMALIYPFSWQHIFIPILPSSLLSYCCAPMPFVVGVLETHLEEVKRLPMDEVLIVDIDNNIFLRTPETHIDSDIKLLPLNHHVELLKQLKNARRLVKRSKYGQKSRILRGTVTEQEIKTAISDVEGRFLQFFVELMGPAFRLHYSSSSTYNVEAFKEASPKDHRPLLDGFSCSQMFERFIRLQLISDSHNNSLFDRTIRSWLRSNTLEESKKKLTYSMACVSSIDPMRRGKKRPMITHQFSIACKPRSYSSVDQQKRIPLKGLPPVPDGIGAGSNRLYNQSLPDLPPAPPSTKAHVLSKSNHVPLPLVPPSGPPPSTPPRGRTQDRSRSRSRRKRSGSEPKVSLEGIEEEEKGKKKRKRKVKKVKSPEPAVTDPEATPSNPHEDPSKITKPLPIPPPEELHQVPLSTSKPLPIPPVKKTELPLPFVDDVIIPPRDGGIEETPKVREMQKKLFLRYVNAHLSLKGLPIQNFVPDFLNGVSFILLVEAMSQTPLSDSLATKCKIHPSDPTDYELNFYYACQHLKDVGNALPVQCIEGILCGDLSAILDLLWAVVYLFEVAPISCAEKLGVGAVFSWTKLMVEGYPVEFNDFKDSFKNGMIFNTILGIFNEEAVDFSLLCQNNSIENLKYAFDVANRLWNIPMLLDPEDVADSPDDVCIIIYLALYCSNLS